MVLVDADEKAELDQFAEAPSRTHGSMDLGLSQSSTGTQACSRDSFTNQPYCDSRLCISLPLYVCVSFYIETPGNNCLYWEARVFLC